MAELREHRAMVPRLAAGELTPADGRAVLQHLLSGCGTCSQALGEWTQGSAGRSGTGLDSAVFARALHGARRAAAATAPAQRQAPALVEELEALPSASALERVQEPRFASIEVCAALAAKSFSLREIEPARAGILAELAVSVADRLDPRDRRARDACGRAWSCIANLCWRAGDLVAAEQAIQKVDDHLAAGTGDPYLLAAREELVAGLRMGAGRFADSIAPARRSVSLYRRLGDDHRTARARVGLGAFLGLDGRPEDAIRILRRALTQLEPGRDPRMELGARHNLALMLLEAGRVDEAAAQLTAIRPLYPQLRSQQHVLDARWLEGKILVAQGEHAAAEEALVAARDGYLDLPNPLDAAFVTLELATLYLTQGRTREVRSHAAILLAFFRGHRVERDALAAVILFAEAVESDRLTAELVLQITAAIQNASTGER